MAGQNTTDKQYMLSTSVKGIELLEMGGPMLRGNPMAHELRVANLTNEKAAAGSDGERSGAPAARCGGRRQRAAAAAFLVLCAAAAALLLTRRGRRQPQQAPAPATGGTNTTAAPTTAVPPPAAGPTTPPSHAPSRAPTRGPTAGPTTKRPAPPGGPTAAPTATPSARPTENPTAVPPSTAAPTAVPSEPAWDDATYLDTSLTYNTDYPAGKNKARTVTLRVHYSPGALAAAAAAGARARVVLVSHGGQGSERGHRSFAYIAAELVGRGGYVCVNIGHRTSKANIFHRWDRPHDVSAAIDALAGAGALPGGSGAALAPALPAALAPARLDVASGRVGHLGHSWGAYTAHAVAGAAFEDPVPGAAPGARWTFRDPRVGAVVAFSPQGWGQFGQFDVADSDGHACSQAQPCAITDPSRDNSWRTVTVPAYVLIGQREMDGAAGVEVGAEGTYMAPDWRLTSFVRYAANAAGTRFATVIPGATHEDLGGNPDSDALKAYLAVNARLFFDVYLRGRAGRKPEIGLAAMLEGGVDNRRR